MNNNRITTVQMISTATVFLMGSYVVTGASAAAQDSWVTVLIGTAISVPFVLVYARVQKLYPGQDLFSIMQTVLGKVVGKIFIALFTLFSLVIGGYSLRTYSEMIKIIALPETRQLVVQSFMLVVCVWIAKSGIETLGRLSRFIVPVIVVSVLIVTVISIPFMHRQNLMPVLGNPFGKIMKTSVIAASLPLSEIVLCGALFSSWDQKKSPRYIYIASILVFSALMLIIDLRNVTVLGTPSVRMYYYPSYEAASIISFGDFFTRVEVTVGVNFTLGGALKVAFCILVSAIGLSKLLDIADVRKFVSPAALIVLYLAGIVFKSTPEQFDTLTMYPMIVLPFEVILPLILLIAAEIQSRKRRASAPGVQNEQKGKI